MRRHTMRVVVMAAFGLLAMAADQARADFRYTLDYSAASLTYGGSTFQFNPVSISFTLPALLVEGDDQTVNPPIVANGLTITRVQLTTFNAVDSSLRLFPDQYPSTPGDVQIFYFRPLVPPSTLGVGTYTITEHMQNAFRLVSTGAIGIEEVYSDATLTISEVPAVPEPTSLVLMAAGTPVMIALALRRRRG